MRISIVGAGAIGGVIAGYLLSRGEHDVSLIARGAHLEAIQREGLTVHSRGKVLHSRPKASDDPAALGKQDIIVCTVKVYGLSAIVQQMGPLRDDATPIVFVQNGIPWWFFYGIDGQRGDFFNTTDPDGRIWHTIGPEHAIGAVAHMPANVTQPGTVTHQDGPLRLSIGAPWPGQHQETIAAICDAFVSAGIDAKETDIRRSIWEKLRLNTGRGPLAVLTGGTIGQLMEDPGVRALSEKIVDEVVATARAWGSEIDPMIAPIPAGTARHKPSILQDFESGRRVEIDPIITSLVDLAHRRDVPVPTTEALLALTRLKVKLRDKG